MATAISMYYMSQQIGIAIGISLCSSLLKERFKSSLVGVLGDLEGGLEVRFPPFVLVFSVWKRGLTFWWGNRLLRGS